MGHSYHWPLRLLLSKDGAAGCLCPQALHLVLNPSTWNCQPGPQRQGCLIFSWLLQITLYDEKETNRQQGINTPHPHHSLGSNGKAENSFFYH